MRYPASEKLEIIRLVEQSHLGVGSTVDKLGMWRTKRAVVCANSPCPLVTKKP